jgi:hypothetical protein
MMIFAIGIQCVDMFLSWQTYVPVPINHKLVDAAAKTPTNNGQNSAAKNGSS